MPTTTLRAHIAMVTSSSTTPISSICFELRFPKRLLLAQHSFWQQPAAGSLLSLTLISSHLCEIRLYNWLSLSAGLWHKKKGEKERNNELVKQQELWEPLTEKQATFSPHKKQGFSNGYGPLYINPIH